LSRARPDEIGVLGDRRGVARGERELRLVNETVLLRFAYDYEVDLDRINSEADLLNWTLHLCGKTWMTVEHLGHFIETVAQIKGFKVHG
jgi:hypothetical protein